MKKAFYYVFLICSILWTATACQPTPEQEIVINKNDGAFESAIAATAEATAEQGEAAEDIWQDAFVKREVDVKINAKIVKPEVEKYTIQKVRSRNFTDEELKKFVDVLFGNNQVRRFDSYTKSEREEMLIRAKETLQKMLEGDESVIDKSYSMEDQIAEQRKEIESIEKGLATASDTSDTGEEIPVEFVTDEEWGDTYFDGCTELNGTTAHIHVSLNSNGIKNVSAFSFDRDADNNLGMDPVEGSPLISEKEALEQALEVAEQLGVGEVALRDVIVVSGEKGDLAYKFEFDRLYSGMPLKNPEQLRIVQDDTFIEQYNVVYYPEEIVIAVDDQGIRELLWNYPCEVLGTVNENAKIQSFEQVKELFPDYLFQTTAQLGKMKTEIEITEVRLCAAMMRVKDGEQGEFYIIPVWDFMGNGVEIGPVDGREYALSELSDTASIVTINAIDGSNFDRFYMY